MLFVADYDVQLVKNGIINGLSPSFLLSQGVSKNLLDFALDSIPTAQIISPQHSTPIPIPSTSKLPMRPGYHEKRAQKNKERSKKRLQKKLSKSTFNTSNSIDNNDSEFPLNADDFLNSLSLKPTNDNAFNASLVEPPNQTFNYTFHKNNFNKKFKGKRVKERNKPFLTSDSCEIVIEVSDDEGFNEDKGEENGSINSTSMEVIPDFVIGGHDEAKKKAEVKNAINHQLELKRKQNEIYEMQLKIKELEIKKHKQKLALALERQRMKKSQEATSNSREGSANIEGEEKVELKRESEEQNDVNEDKDGQAFSNKNEEQANIRDKHQEPVKEYGQGAEGEEVDANNEENDRGIS